jgi:hypothetical protein
VGERELLNAVLRKNPYLEVLVDEWGAVAVSAASLRVLGCPADFVDSISEATAILHELEGKV